MLRIAILPIAVLVVSLTSSCGKKKIEAAQSQVSQLQARNSELESNVATLQKQATDYQSQYNSVKDEYDKYKASCQQKEAQLEEIRAVLTDEANSLMKLQELLENALAEFKDKGVDVYYREGLVHVSMADQLLYKSGSSALGEEGKRALGTLANVLNEYPKLKVIVLGNTDNVKYKKGGDNWTLSTERANGVVRFLREKYNVEPTRLTSAGKAMFNPIADNSTAEGRAKNRRTDIILNPDIDRLWEMARQNK
ncbi:OmpA family protein [Flavisolibacter tropicus]|uniref:OmpA family protein n=1 Tax=Flavisolibacter tropicus TaxID=1492898 RepID=UPI00082E564A|nr:OmpA family protein [Flavisolibacter tropicus]